MSSRIIIGFKNNLDSDFLKKKSANIDQIVRFMITFLQNKILYYNLSVFINKSPQKKDLIKFAKIFDQICYKISN